MGEISTHRGIHRLAGHNRSNRIVSYSTCTIRRPSRTPVFATPKRSPTRAGRRKVYFLSSRMRKTISSHTRQISAKVSRVHVLTQINEWHTFPSKFPVVRSPGHKARPHLSTEKIETRDYYREARRSGRGLR